MKKFLFLLLLNLMVLNYLPQKIQAATALDLQVYPPVAYLSVKPGAGINHVIKLKNNGIYTLEITPALVNFHSDERLGRVILEQKSDFAYLNLEGDPNKWGKSFLIKPGEEQILNFVIALPSETQPKEHYLSILFQAKQLFYTSAAAKDSLVSAMVASNLVLLISGDEQNRGKLVVDQFDSPKLVDSFMGFSFSAMVKNLGNNATPITGHFKVSHWPDQKAEVYDLYPDMVLAGHTRLVRAMSAADLKNLELMEESKTVKKAAGDNYELEKEEFIQQKLRAKLFYKKSFLLGAYDLELKIGDDVMQKRVIALPFSILIIAVLLPIFYRLLLLLNKTFKK